MAFYNIMNQEISQEELLEELIRQYNQLNQDNKTRVTDFSEGSEVRSLLEILTHIAYTLLEEDNNTLSAHFINTAFGEYLDLLGANPYVNLPRNTGTVSTGLVKFSLPDITDTKITIPSDTTVGTDNVEFRTLDDGTIYTGESYTYILVESTIEGEECNVEANTINKCELSGFIVNNEEKMTGGTDYEDDEAYRTRLLDFTKSEHFGSRKWYENIMLMHEGVHDIKRASLYDNDIDYYINTNSPSDEEVVYIIMDLLQYFNDDNNHSVRDNVKLRHSYKHLLVFDVEINADCGYSREEIQDFFKCYFRGDTMQDYPISFLGFNIGEEADEETIKQDIMTYLEDITHFTISNIQNDYNGVATSDFHFHCENNDFGNYGFNYVHINVNFVEV